MRVIVSSSKNLRAKRGAIRNMGLTPETNYPERKRETARKRNGRMPVKKKDPPMSEAAQAPPIVQIPRLELGQIRLHIVGGTELVTNKFSHSATQQIIDKVMGKASAGRKKRVPTEEFLGGLYVMPGHEAETRLHATDELTAYATGRFGFPAVGFKKAMISAANSVGLVQTQMRQAFHIDAEYVEIQCVDAPGPKMRMDMVRLAGPGRPADVRFRPDFENWKAEVDINYVKTMITPEIICNLAAHAGFKIGIGEWRNEKSGVWGKFFLDGYSILPDKVMGNYAQRSVA